MPLCQFTTFYNHPSLLVKDTNYVSLHGFIVTPRCCGSYSKLHVYAGDKDNLSLLGLQCLQSVSHGMMCLIGDMMMMMMTV
jgi:hypothetical protein